MTRLRAGWPWALVLATALPAPSARGGEGEDEAAPPSGPLLFAFEGDPEGRASRADLEARGHLLEAPGAPADPAAAARRWMELAESESEALLPAPEDAGGGPGTWWPAREVAFARLARLPDAGRRAVEERWGPRARADLERALATRSTEPLERVTAEAPVTSAGLEALLLLADDAVGRGDGVAGARHLRRWLAFAPTATPAARAEAGARLVDACALAGDVMGVGDVVRRLREVADVPVRRGDARTTLLERGARAFAEARARRAERRRRSDARPLEGGLSLAWSVALPDGPHGRAPSSDDEDEAPGPPPPAAVETEGSAVWLASRSRVRRLDLETGLERWAFPAAAEIPRRRSIAPWQAAPASDRPASLTKAGRLLLAVLTDEPELVVLRPVRPRRFGRALLVMGGWSASGDSPRARLVALDAETGTLAWSTGRSEESDPVLGADDVGVTSPPLVDGARVWVVLSARRAAVVSWLACLDLATGRARSVTRLGSGEGGLVGPATGPRRWRGPSVAAMPSAQRPSRAGDEIAVAPGTGYLAGVAAEDGRLRWIQALPAHDWGSSSPDAVADFVARAKPEPQTFDPRGAVLSAAGTWFVAQVGAPSVAAVASGTGGLRWAGPHLDAPGPMGWPEVEGTELVGVHATPQGGLRLRLAGPARGLALLDADTGALAAPRFGGFASGPDVADEAPTAMGRVATDEAHAWGWRTKTVVRVAWPAEDGDAWDAGAVPGSGEPDPSTVDDATEPRDVVRASGAWLAIGPDRIEAWAPSATLVAWRTGPPRDAADAAARAIRAAKEGSAAGLSRAIEAARAAPTEAVRALLLDALAAALGGLSRGLEPVPEVLEAATAPDLPLAAEDRARLRWRVASAWFRGDEHDKAARVADAMLRAGDEGLVETEDGEAWMRADLAALDLLRRCAAASAGADVLRARDEEAAARDGGARAMAGTPSAWVEGLSRLAAALDASDAARAAREASDLRLAPPVRAEVGVAAAQALRALEGEALAEAGETSAARVALFEAERAGPGAARSLDGAPVASLSGRLAAREPFAPEAPEPPGASPRTGEAPDGPPSGAAWWSTLPVEAGPAEGEASAAVSSVEVLPPSGPGASPSLAHALLATGPALESCDLAAKTRAPLAPRDEGWIGVSLEDLGPAAGEAGALVRWVAPHGPADRAGWRKGDVVVSWAGRPVEDRRGLERDAAEAAPGLRVATRVRRAGAEVEATVEVGDGRWAADRSRPPRFAWMRNDHEAVVACPYGLRVVDLVQAASRDLWRSREAGEVAFASASAGTVWVATGDEGLANASLVAVDAATGDERWVAELPGPAAGAPRACGSAVVVDLADPARTAIVDARDGRLRSVRARLDTGWRGLPWLARPWFARLGLRAPRPATEPGSADAAGLVCSLLESGKGWQAVNSSTGAVAHVYDDAPRGRVDYGEAGLAVGSLVATVGSDQRIRTWMPSLTGDVPEGSLRVAETDLFALDEEEIHGGPALLATAGDLVYLLRAPKWRVAQVVSLERKREGSPAFESRGLHRLLTAGPAKAWVGFTHARASLDGLEVVVMETPETRKPSARRVAWIRPGRAPDIASLSFVGETASTQPVTRVGSTALVPADASFLAVTLRAVPAR
jgi:hypothetical protein